MMDLCDGSAQAAWRRARSAGRKRWINSRKTPCSTRTPRRGRTVPSRLLWTCSRSCFKECGYVFAHRNRMFASFTSPTHRIDAVRPHLCGAVAAPWHSSPCMQMAARVWLASWCSRARCAHTSVDGHRAWCSGVQWCAVVCSAVQCSAVVVPMEASRQRSSWAVGVAASASTDHTGDAWRACSPDGRRSNVAFIAPVWPHGSLQRQSMISSTQRGIRQSSRQWCRRPAHQWCRTVRAATEAVCRSQPLNYVLKRRPR